MTGMFNLLDLTNNPNHLFPHTSCVWESKLSMPTQCRLYEGPLASRWPLLSVFFTRHGENRAGFLVSSLMKSHHESSSFITSSFYNYSHNTISKCHQTEGLSHNSNLGKGRQDWVHSSKWLWTSTESGSKHLPMHGNWSTTLISVHKTWYNKRNSHKNISD